MGTAKRYPVTWLFYLLAFYIVLSFVWWGWLLYEQNKEAYQGKVALLEYQLQNIRDSEKAPVQIEQTEAHQELKNKYDRQKLMILGEGLVFLIILGAGMFLMRRALIRDREVTNLQKNLLLSITHELKSPLASIKVAMETIAKRKPNADQTQMLVANTLIDTERLESLVDNILMAAKIESRNFSFNKEKCNLSLITEDIINKLIVSRNITNQVEMEIQPDVYLYCDRTAITSVVLNLVENAIKYSPPESPLNINLHQKNKKIEFSVADFGPGIPENEKDKIFFKFYRIGNEDTRVARGTGLGLFIVKTIIDKTGGKISVENNKPKGSIFRVCFDKADN